MKFNTIHTVYFVGVGGIGMSALARYFKSQGKKVLGYDKTKTDLTTLLEQEGIEIHYEDLGEAALNNLEKETTLVIYTPAIPKQHRELIAFMDKEFFLIKRAKALGIISSEFETFAVAGTHGKTTTSTILAHVLNQTPEKCNAFIGGISVNYNSNCILNPNSKRVVVEADEFDRSFLQLDPNYAIITSMDADHLDIYGDGNHLKLSFNDFINKVERGGMVMVQADLDIHDFKFNHELKIRSYGFSSKADWRGENIRYSDGRFLFDIYNNDKVFADVELGIPGKHNAENAVAVFGLTYELGVSEEVLRAALLSFKGVQRRFEYKIRREDFVLIDDYAHHPTEIEAFLSSVRKMYPAKKITAIFQPHLFSRTRDFMDDFAISLSLCDELFLLDIYPARELPMEGITSDVLLEKVSLKKKYKSSKSTIVDDLKSAPREVVVIIGAGDIDTCVKPITKAYLL